MKGLRNKKYLILFIAILPLLACVAYAANQSSANYQISIDVITGGGGGATSTNYSAGHTTGQSTAIGESSSTNFNNYAGFQYALSGAAAGPGACIDTDGDGYGSPGDPSCPKGGVPDCDDTNSAINPGATEGPSGNATCSDTKDNDCDGFTDGNDTNCNSTVSDLTVTSVSNPPTSRKRGSSFKVTAKIKNKGVEAADKEFTIGYYLSKNRDKLINKEADIMLTDNIIVSSLVAGKSSTKKKIPVSIGTDTPPGKYYVKVCADNRHDISETNEDNNCRASQGKIKVK